MLFITTTVRIHFRSCHTVPNTKWFARYKSSASSRHLKHETRRVQVGGNGYINLKFFRPKQPQLSNKYIVILQPGPFPLACIPEKPSLDALALSHQLPEATIIDVQYRLSPKVADPESETDHRFPTPIHDVCAALDYIVEIANTNNNNVSINQHDAQNASKIILYGSHIGASLALTVTLTNPHLIHSLILENPLIDWPGLEEIQALKPHKRKPTSKKEHYAQPSTALINLRTNLFRTPSGYFDPFASPVLFLRAPGRDTPLTKSAAPDDVSAERMMNGTPIRYGEEEGEVGVLEDDERHDYGPYDDEWHAVETTDIRNREYRIDGTSVVKRAVERSDYGSSELAEDESVGGSGEVSSALAPRRRKVLQRWPPIVQPDEALLPPVHVFLGSTVQQQEDIPDILPVTRLQGLEIVDLLRRACFWGREKSFAEERVLLTTFEDTVSESQRRDRIVESLNRSLESRG